MLNINGDDSDIFYRYKREDLLLRYNQKQGKTLVLNINSIAKDIYRDVSQIKKYFAKTIGTSVNIDKEKNMVLNGIYDKNTLNRYLQDFINKDVLCQSCDNPETEYINNKLKCRACGYIKKIDKKILK